MKKIVKTSDPRQLLVLAPHLAGGTPTRSALILPFIGKRTGSAIRIDLPTGTCGSSCNMREPAPECIDQGHADAADWARTITDFAVSLGAQSIAVILYPGHALGLEALPLQTAMEAVVLDAESRGIRILATLVAGTDSWGDYRHPDEARGPLAEIDELDRGDIGRPDPGELVWGSAALPPQPGPLWSAGQMQLINRLLDEDPGDHDPILAVDYAMGNDRPALTDREVAVLTSHVQSPVVRDEMLMTMIAGVAEGRKTREASFEWNRTGSSERVEEEAALIMGVHGSPDRARIERAREVWHDVAARTISEQQPAVYAVLAWLHWAMGAASTAAACVERAAKGDPDHGFTQIVGTIIESGHVPCWIHEAFHAAEDDDLRASA